MNSSKSLSIACIVAASLIAAVSCKKEFDKMVVETTALQDKAFVKVYNGAISSQRTYMYVDNVPVTGSLLAYGGFFPSTTYASALVPGNRNILIKDTLATSAQPAINFTANLVAGKNYS